MQRTAKGITLLAAMAAAACGRGSELSAPEGPALAAAAAAATAAQIAMTGAVYTDPPGTTQSVNIKTESASELVLQKNALRTGLAYASVDSCVGNLALAGYLVDSPADRVFSLKYDKSGSTNPGHFIYLTRLDAAANVRVRLQSGWAGYGNLPDVTVEVTTLSANTTRYTYRGGAVKVEYLPPKPQKGSEMVCHNHTDIVVDLTR